MFKFKFDWASKFPNKLFLILYFPQISGEPEGRTETANDDSSAA